MNDPQEREADSIAERVMAASGPEVIRRGAPETIALQKCKLCQEEEGSELRRKPQVSRALIDNGFSFDLNRAGLGRPLSEPTSRFMESRLSADLSRVKIHDDPHASRLASSIGARAFTRGHDIFFGQGEYRPNLRSGMKLIAHELAHVVQQGAAPRLPSANEGDAPRATPTRSDLLQRKVLVGGSPLPRVGSRKFRQFVERNRLEGHTDMLATMHASKGAIEYATAADCALDVKVRQASVLNLQWGRGPRPGVA